MIEIDIRIYLKTNKRKNNDMLKKKENDELKNVEVDVVSSRVALKDLNYIGCIFVC